MLRATKITMFLSAALVCLSCENSEQKKQGDSKDAQKQKTESSSSDAKADKPDGENESDVSIDLADLFQDEINIKISDFDVYTACGDLFSSTSAMKKAILPWPSTLKKQMVSELSKMPIKRKIAEAVIGYYFVKSGNMDNAAGLLCGTKDRNRGVIFIDEDSMDETGDASKDGLSSDYTLRTLPVPFPVWTIVHETMHAIDHFYYSDPQTGLFSESREKAANLAWAGITDSKYNEISILSLTGPAAMKRTCILSRKPKRSGGGFSLVGNSPEQDAQDLEYMEGKTNFITPYAMTNAFEDFADTNTAYYIGTRKGWPVWKTYSYDISRTELNESKVVHEYDAKDTIKNSTKHRKKMCALAGLVFDEDCESKLP